MNSAASSPAVTHGPPLPARRGWPAGVDPVAAALVALGFALLVAALLWDWSTGRRADGTQGHEVAIFAVSAFLLYRKRHQLAALATPGAPITAAILLALGASLYLFGRAYELRIALLSLMVALAAVLLRFKGVAALRMNWFAVLFPVFAIPLPLEFVLLITGPLKVGVSAFATHVLSWAGFPIGRSGVVVTIGQYQLLVTEACAGLQTMFTLEAMGLLYASLMNHESAWRNALLAILVVPIAFLANVVRVIVLALITYYFGDAAGQGFLHGFSGVVLFLVGLALVMATDGLLGRVLRQPR
jgi:exosortase B